MSQETAIAENVPTFPTPEKIESVEAMCLKLPQIEMPLTHAFAPGVYFREIFMPAGTFVIGHAHKTEHFNVVLTGRASVLCDGNVMEIKAPFVFVSKAGVRKMLHIHEDMRWATIHPTDETDLEKLEHLLIEKSDSFTQHEKEIETLKNYAAIK